MEVLEGSAGAALVATTSIPLVWLDCYLQQLPYYSTRLKLSLQHGSRSRSHRYSNEQGAAVLFCVSWLAPESRYRQPARTCCFLCARNGRSAVERVWEHCGVGKVGEVLMSAMMILGVYGAGEEMGEWGR
jgi:hypothetical protein